MVKKKHTDCWSPAERNVQRKIAKIKKIIFYPIAAPLTKIGVTANMMSIFCAILGVVAAAYMFIDLKIATILLIIAVLGDGIDGAMARMTQKNHAKGALIDEFCDQIVILSTTIAFAGIGLLHYGLAIYYSAVYPPLIIFSTLRNRLGIPNWYVLRPRLLMYAVFLIYFFTGTNWLNHAAIIFSVIMTAYIVKDFIKLREIA